jgi:protein tyrosine/serine phosphatase
MKYGATKSQFKVPTIFRLSCGALILASVVGYVAADRGVPASYGIVNFGRVNDHLYRGAQPDANGIANLKKLGVTLVINLRTKEEPSALEAAEASSNAIAYTNIPLKGVSRPSDQDIARILAIIDNAPGPVFVHCEHGCDRTGTVIGCYRIQHDGWAAHAVFKEADRYGMSELERGMRAYIADFARKQKKRPWPTTKKRSGVITATRTADEIHPHDTNSAPSVRWPRA